MRLFLLPRLIFALSNRSSRYFCDTAAPASKIKAINDQSSQKYFRPPISSDRKTNLFTYRTHTCGELRSNDVGKKVTLCGWLHYNRGKFFVLRDAYGLIQIIVPSRLVKEMKKLHYESILKIEGVVETRPSEAANAEMATGSVEIVLEKYELLNSAMATLPFEFRYDDTPTDEVRLRYRYMDLRRDDSQRNLRFRSQLIQRMRRYLHEKCDFVEIETPTLFRRTPGGAAEFPVASSDFPGKFYCLPQSPQQFKQLLMIGGLDRYFQVARCYRDEGGQSDRQPEFTQLDIELSFTDQDGVMEVIENLISESWPDEMIDDKPTTPFPRMRYETAMTRYGSDKPDLRFDMEIEYFDDNAAYVGAPYEIDDDDLEMVERWCDTLSQQHSSYATSFAVVRVHRNGYCQSIAGDNRWFENLTGDWQRAVCEQLGIGSRGGTIIFALSNDDSVDENRNFKSFNLQKTLGFFRLRLADYLENKGIEIRRKNRFEFSWITDFPLFLPKSDTESKNEWESAHHPFTAPIPIDEERLLKTNEENIGQIIGQHYDLVLNGVELGGGSIRIHDAVLQRYVLQNILKEDVSELRHLLEALESGAPPHGGFAIGLDRYLAILLNRNSIKDVIAFPKTKAGRDPMCDAPAPLTQDQLKRYHIRVVADEEKPI